MWNAARRTLPSHRNAALSLCFYIRSRQGDCDASIVGQDSGSVGRCRSDLIEEKECVFSLAQHAVLIVKGDSESMNRIYLLVAVSLCLLLTAEPVIAMTLDGSPAMGNESSDHGQDGRDSSPVEPLFGDRLSLKVGYKVWVARWQTTGNPIAFTSANTGPGGLNQVTSTDSVMSGPSGSIRLKLRNGSWFNSLIGGFTFLNSGFDFREIGSIEEGAGRSVTKENAMRKDYTATIGLSIYESVGIFAGYYWSEQQFTIRNTSTFPTGPPLASTTFASRELQGPIFGLYGSAPISERVSFYGNMAYALLRLRSNEGVRQGELSTPGLNTDAVQGWAAEVGTTIRGPNIWKIGTDLQIGFRGQMILKTFGQNAPSPSRLSGTFGNDVTWGPTFTISATF